MIFTIIRIQTDASSPRNSIMVSLGNHNIPHPFLLTTTDLFFGDDNVHLQNSMEFSEALIQNNKTFDMMIYPDKNHGIYGGNTRKHLYEKMTRFILDNL